MTNPKRRTDGLPRPTKRHGRNPEVHLYEGEWHGVNSDVENQHNELLIEFFWSSFELESTAAGPRGFKDNARIRRQQAAVIAPLPPAAPSDRSAC
jgi:hypothetical protein